ncbi:MAG: hypothetical protein ACXVGH_04970, partial [Mycobacteriales bacterium]
MRREPHRAPSAPRRLAVVPDVAPAVPEQPGGELDADAQLAAEIEVELARTLAESLHEEIVQAEDLVAQL